MCELLIVIGLLCMIAGFMGRKEKRRQSDYNDWVYTRMEEHNWTKPRKKR